MSEPWVDALHRARAAEKEQTLFYRYLAVHAEAANLPLLADRLNGLLADEQHHLSRITARLLELGENVSDLAHTEPPHTELDGWETVARARERDEVDRYSHMPLDAMDDETRRVVEETLATERRHESELDGKWTMA